jgi:phytoene dehydrogenase-like protein
MAPSGQDTLIGIVPVGHMTDGAEPDWKELMDQARQAIFNKLRLVGITDLEAHIKFETCFTPLSWRKRYNLMRGATHGLCHNLMQLGYFRPRNRHPRYHNLYFVGASTHPGTGMPTALISARLAAQRLREDL